MFLNLVNSFCWLIINPISYEKYQANAVVQSPNIVWNSILDGNSSNNDYYEIPTWFFRNKK